MPATNARSSTRHAGLDRDDVVDRALAMVEEGGPQALSMRKLAADLGVTTTTIYWHVGNREELVLALIQRQADRQAASEIVGTDPRARVTSAARNIWRNALAHRNVTALASQIGATTLLELPLEAALAAELEAAGVRGPDARDALRAILACIAGFLVVAWRSNDRVPQELRADALWSAVAHPGLSDDTRAAMAEPVDVDALFETALGAVVGAYVTQRPRRARR